MSSSIKYRCPKTGQVKEKLFVGGVTTIKQEQFVELIQRRDLQNQLVAERDCLKERVLERSEQVNILQAERDSAIIALDKNSKVLEEKSKVLEEKSKSLAVSQDIINKLTLSVQATKKEADAHAAALQTERKKNSDWAEDYGMLADDYDRLACKYDEEKRGKNAESAKAYNAALDSYANLSIRYHEEVSKVAKCQKQLEKERKQHDLEIADLCEQLAQYKQRDSQSNKPVSVPKTSFFSEPIKSRMSFIPRPAERAPEPKKTGGSSKPTSRLDSGWDAVEQALRVARHNDYSRQLRESSEFLSRPPYSDRSGNYYPY